MYYQETFGQAARRVYYSIPQGLRIIITINVVVFFVQLLIPDSWNLEVNRWLGLSPDAAENILQPWRLITYQFLHAHFFHLLFNMLWLGWMGAAVEQAIGTRSVVQLYLGSGIGGGLIHAAAAALFGGGLTIGASGSVFGVMVGFAMIFPSAPIMLLFLPPLEARFVVAGLILIDVLFLGANDNAARIVHLGGALSGWLLVRTGLHALAIPNPFAAMKQRSASNTSRRNMKVVEDATIIEEVDQSELDAILDKIAKKGYDGLSAAEKKTLFELSKKK
jgi:membrane associated rhomboid family serine protease